MSLLHLLHALSGGVIPDDEYKRRLAEQQAAAGLDHNGELPPSSTQMQPPPQMQPPGDTVGADPIVVTGAHSTQRVGNPQEDTVDLPHPSVVQPSYKQDAPAEDPSQVDPNNKALLDRRAMIWNAEEAQKAAAAKAAGGEYTPRFQDGNPKDFKSHPGLQFGTHGVLRDIIGNATDFVGSLIGRKPTYREEKFQDRIYGWDQPGQEDAAMHRGMSYDRGLTQEFMANQDKIHGTDAMTAANADYKTQQGLGLKREALGNAAFGIYGAADPESAYSQGGRERMQAALDDIYPDGKAPQLPEKYDENVVKSLYTAGYKGKDVASTIQTGMRGQVTLKKTDLDNATKRLIAAGHDATTITAAQIRAEATRYAAQTSASSKAEPAPVKIGTESDILGTTQTNSYITRSDVGKGRRARVNGHVGTIYPSGVFVAD